MDPRAWARVAVLSVALVGTAGAQDPAGRWSTVRTEHFRVHFPEAAAEWATPAAARLEEWHRRVTEEVGYVPPRVIDVVVRDPYSTANGMALPLLGGPRIELWVTAPDAGSVVGNLRAWDELLLVHEDTHVVHMTRPSRNPIGRIAGSIFGYGPITAKAPPWVTEGYATVVEGRLTGSGRPNGAFRPALLAAYASEGRLPSYAELSYGTRYLTGSYRYLVGSAYLEWLEAEVGPRVGASEHPLRDLWARMTARETRSFDAAFTGVFRDHPETLYARFCAEVTADAIAREVEPAHAPFLDHPWGVSAPAISPDGARLAAVVGDRRRAPALVVWETAPDGEARVRWDEDVAERLRRDPEDVAPVEPAVWAPKQVARRTSREGMGNPAFLPDGAIVFEAWIPDGEGRYRPDLLRWDPETGRTRRLTRHADLRTPAADGDAILAVRQVWGRTDIVRLDPATGEVAVVVDGATDHAVDQPTPGPRGLAWLEHRGSSWYPVIRTADEELHYELPGVVDLAWGPDGALYGARGVAGRMTIWRLDPEPMQVAAGGGPALGLAVGPDDLWFTALDASGVDIRRLPLDALEPLAVPEWPAPDAPAIPDRAEVDVERYGAGRPEGRLVIGGAFSGKGNTSEYGLRLGDVAGRWESVTTVGYGDAGGYTGAGAALVVRSLPVPATVAGWVVEGPGYGGHVAGGAVDGRLERAFRGGRAAVEGGGLVEAPLAGGPVVAAATLEGAAAWLEPAREWLYLGGIGRLSGGTGWLADSAAVVSVGRLWSVDLAGGAGIAGGDRRFDLGGIDTGIVAPAARWSRLIEPAFAEGTLRGAVRLSADVALTTPFGSLFATRHLVGDALGPAGATVAGLRLGGGVPRQPLAKLPAVDIELGAGIRLEAPDSGWNTEPGTDDLAAWGRVAWGL